MSDSFPIDLYFIGFKVARSKQILRLRGVSIITEKNMIKRLEFESC